MQQALRRRVSPSIIIFAAALVATIWAFGASSASAAVPGLRKEVKGTSFSSSNKGARAECPPELRVIGAGGEINGAGGEVVLEDVIPENGLRSVSVNAREQQGGSSRQWAVSAIAICASPTLGMHLVSADSDSTSSNKSVTTAPCPTGEKLLGTGAEIFGGNGEVKLDQINPSFGLTRTFAFAREDRNGFSGLWGVTAHAICGKDVGQQLVRASRSTTSSAVGVTASCAPGQKALGGGFDSTVLGFGEAVVDSFVPQSINVLAGSKPDITGAAVNRIVEAVAICATP